MNHSQRNLLILACTAALSAAPALNAVAAQPVTTATHLPGSIERAEAKKAQALLASAVEYLQKNGPEQAFAAFNNRNGEFVSGPYYVYVVGMDGTMHANGGAPAALVGKNAMDLHDAAGKPMIRDMLKMAAKHDTGTVKYHWLNRSSNHVENKTVLFHKVGTQVVAVGYYIAHATQEQAKDWLSKAVAELKKAGPDAAFAAFNDPKGGFVRDDLYVFAIGLEDGKYRASGAAPQLSGQDVSDLHDAAGKPIFQHMIALAKAKGSGEVGYVWRNPATNEVEAKHSVIQRVDDVLLGVGYYGK